MQAARLLHAAKKLRDDLGTSIKNELGSFAAGLKDFLSIDIDTRPAHGLIGFVVFDAPQKMRRGIRQMRRRLRHVYLTAFGMFAGGVQQAAVFRFHE